MLANSQSTPSAISMLTSCAVMRPALRLEALISTTSPTVINATTKPSSMPSMWRVR